MLWQHWPQRSTLDCVSQGFCVKSLEDLPSEKKKKSMRSASVAQRKIFDSFKISSDFLPEILEKSPFTISSRQWKFLASDEFQRISHLLTLQSLRDTVLVSHRLADPPDGSVGSVARQNVWTSVVYWWIYWEAGLPISMLLASCCFKKLIHAN